jgi:hypothetical protein
LGEEGMDVLHQCFARAGKDYRAGSSMPHYFLRAGIGPHDGMLYGCTSVPGAQGRQMLIAVLTSLKVPAVKLGLKSEAAYDAFLSALATDAPPADSVTRMPDLISVWKKRVE